MIIQIDILMYNHFVNISGYCTTKRPTLFFHFQVTLLKFYIKPSDVHRHNAYLDFVFVTVILTFDIYWHLIVHHSILFEMDLLFGYKTPSILYKCNFRKGALHEPDHHLYFVNSISTQKYLQKSGMY